MKTKLENKPMSKEARWFNLAANEYEQKEQVVRFLDGNFLMKLAGENTWFILNENGDVVIRTLADGTNEYSKVNITASDGRIFDVQFGKFVESVMQVEISSIDGENIHTKRIMLSPSGLTLDLGSDEYAPKGDLNFRDHRFITSKLHEYPGGFKSIPYYDFDSMDDVHFCFDIAQHALISRMDAYESKKQQILENPEKFEQWEYDYYVNTERNFEKKAKIINDRYQELVNIFKRKQEKKNKTKQAKNQKGEE